jgi:redox-regulated HSP33 family molecular chaperone
MLPSIRKQLTSGARNDRVQHLTDVTDEKTSTMPPQWLLDKIADEKLTGGYNVRKSNICPGCFEAKSVNGSCSCSSD